MDWFWIVLSVLLSLWVFQELLGQGKKKKLPPGPKGLPIFGHLHLLGKNPHQDLHHLARKHGTIMYLRLGFVPAVVVSSPAGAELVLKTHDLVFANRPKHQVWQHLTYGQRDVVLAPYGPRWRDMRRLITLQLFSNHKINQFQSMRRAEVGLLVSSLRQAAELRETVDISSRIASLSADTTCLMVFGRKYAGNELNEKGFKAVIDEVLQVVGIPDVGDYIPVISMLDLQGLNRRIKKLSKMLDGFLEKIIDDHLQNEQDQKQTRDFVDTMMAILESGQAGFEFDRRNVKAVLLDMLLAGVDTSASTVDWALTELIRHPKAMKKLQKELEAVVGMDKIVEESDLDKLDYLDCIVKETFRLHPVAPLLIHESMEDCELDGFHVPKGSKVFVNSWSIGRDPKVWNDPEKFIPERFAGSNLDVRGHDFQLIPFGSGRRICAGLQLGLTMVKLVLAQLVHCFDWELPNGTLPADLDMTEHFGIVICREKHLMVIPTYRLQV